MIYHFSILDWQKEYLQSKSNHNSLFSATTIQDTDFSNSEDIEIISVFIHDKVDSKIIDQLPNLKLIVTRSTGIDHIDTEYAKLKNIAVCNVPAYGSETVAEFAFSLLMTLMRNTTHIVNRTKKLDFNYQDLLGQDLNGKTLGVLGSGKIGKNMIQIAKGHGLEVVVYDIFQDYSAAQNLGFTYLPFETVLGQADILSLHLPLTQETKDIFSRSNLLKIKPNCIFINVSRGDLIANDDLLWALDNGVFSKAGLDTLEGEKEMFKGNITETQKQILTHPKVIYTPHCAYYTKEAMHRILDTTSVIIDNFRKHNLVNKVN